MSNTFDLACPKCGGTDDVNIQATVWVTLVYDGTDAHGDHEWDDDSEAYCANCDWLGRVKELKEI